MINAFQNKFDILIEQKFLNQENNENIEYNEYNEYLILYNDFDDFEDDLDRMFAELKVYSSSNNIQIHKINWENRI